jgi:3-dehydroquinate synthase
MTKAYTERTTPVFALGGGVVGDMAGFVAATYLRGVCAHPGTDTQFAGPGGFERRREDSCSILRFQEHDRFVLPARLVIADTDTLRTLPDIEYVNGLGEVIKHAAIRNALFFEFLEKNMPLILSKDEAILQAVVADNVRIKAEVVSKDERETGLREILNYGHTIGHAVETVSGFKLKHGQSVAIGMVAAARLSSRMGILPAADVARLEDLIAAAGLPVRIPDIDRKTVLEAMKRDKKVRRDRLRFILLRSLGHAFVSEDVDMSLVEEGIRGWG